MSTYSYKCPNCSGPLEFKPELAKLKCDYCGSQFTEEEIDEFIKNNPDKKIVIDDESTKHKHDHAQEGDSHEDETIKGYSCQNCGAEVVTSPTTLTTFCYYCHSPVIIVDRALGEFRPNRIIPFKVDKKKAEDIFLSWAKSKRYVDKNFYSQSQLDKITGMYLPYWSISAKYDIDLKGIGYKVDVSRRGDTEYTNTSSYEIDRNADFSINNLSELAYTKVDKSLLDSITPYNFEDAVDFKTYYMNGFFSETYDKKFEDVKNILMSRSEGFVNRNIKESLMEYSSYNLEYENYSIANLDEDYLLLPTWMMTYDYHGKKYIYAMNGQTGKAFGELPIDNKLIVKDAIWAGLAMFILILLGGAFIW